MLDDFDPHIDAVVAARWAALPVAKGAASPWLHEEVARRMMERLDFIKLPVDSWTHWLALRGGLAAHRALMQRYKAANCTVVEVTQRLAAAKSRMQSPWWKKLTRAAKPLAWRTPPELSQDMIWCNMALHALANPKATIEAWHTALKTEGYVLFSCFGPDTLKELRLAYARRNWGDPMHSLTDMHDWGDRLIGQGFAEPVMDMERLTLTFATPERALQELRELGRNLNPERGRHFQGLRGKIWRTELLTALSECRNSEGQITLTFELIYGHAIKPVPRIPWSANASISLQTMRGMLHK